MKCTTHVPGIRKTYKGAMRLSPPLDQSNSAQPVFVVTNFEMNFNQLLVDLMLHFTSGLDETDFSKFYVLSLHVISFVVDVELK